MDELKEKTLWGVKWNAIGRFSTQGIGFVIGLILARILSPDDYGVIGMVGIFFSIAGTFIDSGLGSALIRKKDCTDVDYSTAFYFNIVVGLLCCIVLSLMAPFIANFFKTPILRDIVVVMSINMFISSLSFVQGARLTAAIDFKTQAKISLITTVFSGVIGIAMAYNGFGVWSLVWQGGVANILRTILLVIFTKWYPKWQFSKESFKYLFTFGSKILTATLLHTIYANLSTLIIGKFYTPKDLGYYARGESLASMPSTNITGILGSVTYPILSKIQDDEKRLINVYRKYIAMTSMVIFFGMFLLAALAKPLIIVLLTEKWLPSVVFLQVFCFALMFDHLCQLNLNILYVKGRSDLVLRLEVIKKTISISMFVAAIPFGVLAICLSRAVYTQIAVVINTYYTGKLFGLGYLAQVRDFIKYLIFSAIAVVPAFILTYTMLPSIVVILVGGLSACFIYWIMIRKDYNFNELVFLLNKNKRKV